MVKRAVTARRYVIDKPAGGDKRLKNRFDVRVVFPDIAFGIKNRSDVELTPEDVASELEEFCARIRNRGKLPEWVAAADRRRDNPV